MMKKGMMMAAVLMLMGAGWLLPQTAYADAAKEAEALAAADRFYEALNIMFTGNVEPMKALWSHADDVTFMGPAGGLQTGWQEVGEIWDKQAALKLGGKVTPQDMAITLGEDIAITSNYEIGENYDQDGNLQKVSIRATNIFRKEEGEWKMIGHHTDLLPYLEKDIAQE